MTFHPNHYPFIPRNVSQAERSSALLAQMTITVVVDDSDPAIEYSGPWATDIPNDLLSKSLGNTLHNATFQLGVLPSFTYRFNGN